LEERYQHPDSCLKNLMRAKVVSYLVEFERFPSHFIPTASILLPSPKQSRFSGIRSGPDMILSCLTVMKASTDSASTQSVYSFLSSPKRLTRGITTPSFDQMIEESDASCEKITHDGEGVWMVEFSDDDDDEVGGEVFSDIEDAPRAGYEQL
jgi:hypothetical protein